MNSSTPLKKKECSNSGKRNPSDTKEHFRCLDPQGAVKRHTYHLRVDLAEKLRGYAYWNRLGISELMNQILEEFFADKEVQPMPHRERSQYR